MYPMLRVRNGRMGSGGAPNTPIHSSAWKVNSPKSVYDILYNQIPIEESAAPRSPEHRDPNTTCGERT